MGLEGARRNFKKKKEYKFSNLLIKKCKKVSEGRGEIQRMNCKILGKRQITR